MKDFGFSKIIKKNQMVKRNGVYYVIDLTNPKLKQNEK